MPEREACPSGCGRTVAPGKLLCAPCWREVPKDLQADVYSTWRKWRRDFGDSEAFVRYIAARDAALASIR